MTLQAHDTQKVNYYIGEPRRIYTIDFPVSVWVTEVQNIGIAARGKNRFDYQKLF